MTENTSKITYFLTAIVLILFGVFFYTLFTINTFQVYDYMMFALLMVNLTVSLWTDFGKGLILSAVILFLYGSLVVLQSSILQWGGELRLNYIWMGAFPVLAGIGGLLGEKVRSVVHQLKSCMTDIEKYKSIDQETGFRNMNEFLSQLGAEMARARRYGYPLTIGVIELLYFDELKALHKGDLTKVFGVLSQSFLKTMRIEDSKYRIGEKTFAIILPYTNWDNAVILKKRIKEELLQIIVLEENKFVDFKFEIKIGIKELHDEVSDPIKFKAEAEREIEYDV